MYYVEINDDLNSCILFYILDLTSVALLLYDDICLVADIENK